ncbi:MAG TPA: MmcQ/YjbR family DNA-binding protein [Candidatus Dormibacteraeota bacterium]|nr:MmcQ/YjbR family DNA-binding protein [Candidatus Dormibacteraeota bacterium]
MNPEWIRGVCLQFPAVTEHMIWGNDLTFKVANKMFAHAALDPGLPVWLSFKTSSENFYQLTERQNIIPAPYLARAQWVALETRDALPPAELASLLREAYELVVAKLPARTRASLSAPAPSAKFRKVRKPKSSKLRMNKKPIVRKLTARKSRKIDPQEN